jgi:hypothetical protein
VRVRNAGHCETGGSADPPRGAIYELGFRKKKSNMESPSVGLGFDAPFNITASKHIVTLLILHWIV